MAHEVKIPSLGESVTEATIGRWIKQDGEAVAVDEAILELESDKANMDLSAEQAGILRVLKPAGETVHVGDVVARIEPGAAAARDAAAKPAASASLAPAPTGAPAAAPSAAAAAPPSGPPPSATPAAPSAPAALTDASGRPLSPAVRRIAAEEGLDLTGASGTGPGGRVTKGDVLEMMEQRASGGREAAAAPPPAAAATPRATVTPISAGIAAGPAASAAVAQPAPPPVAGSAEERVPMSRVRQVIARRLVEAQHTAAILTTFNEVDMSAILDLRARFKDAFQKQHGVGLGFMSFFVAACCAATHDVPELNARIDGTDVVYAKAVHMGVAVGTERGLVVPVVRNADRLGFAEVEREIARLAALARDAKLTPDDLSGATFTISNGGIYGSLLSTPILNPPQSGILGMHKIEKRPVVIADQVVVRPMMYLALSYDHRLIDGKGAVTFLVRVKERLEDPTRLLLGL